MFEELELRVLLSTVFLPTFVRYSPPGVSAPLAGSASPSGVTPATMRSAYAVDQAVFGTTVGDGTGQTIAIVDAFDQPNIASDLAAFDSFYGLPAPPSFTKVSQATGVAIPPADSKGGWGIEITLDVEWAHVIAPNASILLVEATSSTDANLYTAVDRARNFAGVSVVSMSWGGDEVSGDASNNSHFVTPANHIPVTFVASSGDSGAYSSNSTTSKVVSYPAVSPNVLSVGGTRLVTSSGAYVSETAWGNGTSSYSQSLGGSGGAGGGISTKTSQPSYQSGVVTQSTTFRTVPDVALDADPASGVPIYDTYDLATTTPWATYGGTSLAAPMWAAVIAIADQGRVINGLTTMDGPSVTLPEIYALPAADFHDITSGNNGYAAGTGYDLVTGLGTPIVNLVVRDLAAAPVPLIGAFAAKPGSVAVGNSATLTATNVRLIGGTISNVKFYLESNGTSGLQIGSDTLLGTGTSSGTTFTFSTSTAGLPIGTYTYYAVATSTTNLTAIASATLTVTTPLPVIGSFTVNPASTTVNGAVTLTATGVSEPGGGISSVQFYRETNGNSGLQVDSDTLLGTGTSSGTTWTFSTSATGLSLGTYTYYALATDTAANTISTSATLTVTNPVTSAIFAWNVASQSNFGTQGLKASTVDPSATNTLGLTRGATITTNQTSSSVAGGWGGETWQTNVNSISGAQSITFGLTVSSGYSLSLSSLAMNYRVGNSAGPTNGYWQYQINGGTFNLIANATGEFTVSTNGGAIAPLNLSTVAGLQNLASGTVVIFRLTPYGGSSVHTWFIYHTGATTNDLTISGTASTLSGITPQADFNLASAGGNVYTLSTSGAVTLSTDLSTQGTINLNVGANTQTTINSAEHLASLTINAGAVVSLANISGSILDSQTLTIAATGHLDLAGNFLIVSASDILTLRNLLKNGQIYSSLAGGGALPLNSLAYFHGSDYTSLFGPTASFDGQSVNPTDLLVELTKTGDTNLDNTLDIDDYLNIDTNMLFPPAVVTSLAGDFNFDGLINAADYALLDNATTQQNNAPITPATFSNWTAINAAIAKVPVGTGAILANVSVINLGATLYTGPLNVANTITRIRNDLTIPGDPDDGAVFTNTQKVLPTGTWYEFQVAPSNGSNMNFSSSISAPGPMRLLLDTNGDVYFTGDNNVTFIPVYLARSATPPTIGTFPIAPASATPGTTITLSAGNVVAIDGSNVNLYVESKPTSGLQIGSDTLIGTAASRGATPAPVIGVFRLNPGSLTLGGSVILGATSVVESGSPISSVAFYRDSDSTSGLQTATDTLLGIGASSGTTLNFAFSTAGFTASQFVPFGLTVNASDVLWPASSDMNARHSSSGLTNGLWQYQINNGPWTLIGDFTTRFTIPAIWRQAREVLLV